MPDDVESFRKIYGPKPVGGPAAEAWEASLAVWNTARSDLLSGILTYLTAEPGREAFLINVADEIAEKWSPIRLRKTDYPDGQPEHPRRRAGD